MFRSSVMGFLFTTFTFYFLKRQHLNKPCQKQRNDGRTANKVTESKKTKG